MLYFFVSSQRWAEKMMMIRNFAEQAAKVKEKLIKSANRDT